MSYNVGALDTLVEQFERIPGIGHKSAQRMAFYVLNMPEEDAKKFAESILGARNKIHHCKKCCNLTEDEYCSICRNEARDQTVVCVVEDPRDVDAFERTHEFKGTYHVLHGAISPMSGIGPDQLTIKELLNRLDQPDGGRGSDGDVPLPPLETDGYPHHPPRLRRAGGRHPGVRGRDDSGPRHGRPAGHLT